MREITEHPAYALIDACRKRGVVVDYVIFDAEGAGGDAEAHKLAAMMGMEVLADRYGEGKRETVRSYPGTRPGECRATVFRGPFFQPAAGSILCRQAARREGPRHCPG